MAARFSARGLAVGDFNNDGGLDVLISVNDEAPVLLKNQVGKLSHWLGVRLIGKKCNADAVGARITYQSGDFKRSRFKTGGGSFLSAHDPRVVLGISDRSKIDWVEVSWPQPSGAVERFTGQVSVFDPRREDSPCYRCLFPEPPAAAEAPNCSEAGVLGVLPGIVGLLQATEALKLILGLGEPLVGRLLSFDALGMRFRETRLPRDPACPGCGEAACFSGYEDVAALCSTAG